MEFAKTAILVALAVKLNPIDATLVEKMLISTTIHAFQNAQRDTSQHPSDSASWMACNVHLDMNRTLWAQLAF